MRYRVELAPRACWEVTTDVVPNPAERREAARPVSPGRFGQELGRVQESLTAWQLCVPRLEGTWDALEHVFAQSVSDLASLRMRGGNHGIARLPAAGMPWFMTVFGRDTLITSYQTLLFGSELARGALEVLAELQAVDDDPATRRRAGQDRPRGPSRQGGEGVVPPVLRHRRRHAALPRAALGGLALDRRLRARRPAARPGAAGACVDRRAWRSRRGRLRRVPAANGARPREPVVEGLRRLPALRRRPARGAADRPVRGAGLRLRREAAYGRARSRGLGGRRARRPARRGCRPAARAVRRGVLDRRAWRLLRARARLRQATCRLDVLEHRPPALERDRSAGARRPGGRRADGRRALVGLGGADDVDGRRRLQPALVPQRHGLAARQLPDRGRPRPVRAPGRGVADRPADARGGRVLRLRAARGLRRTAAAVRRRSRSRTRLRRARRPGRPARRCCCSRCCSASSPNRAPPRPSRRSSPTSCPAWAGSLRLSGVRAFDRAWDVRLEDGRVRVEQA